jgi:probable F420-dependent oxidoreductase
LPYGKARDAIRLAKEAEKLGYHSVWGNDHIKPPRYVQEAYDKYPNWNEVLITLSFAAAMTEKIRIGTSVLVLPMREPVYLAKQVATIDHFSNGRLILGVGVGAYREEFEAIKPDSKEAHRGNMLDEGLKALRMLFTEDIASMKGEYYHFQEIPLFPKPLQDPFPIFIGGNNENSLRRVALFGNGWLGACMPPETVVEKSQTLSRFAEENGRDPAELEIAPQLMVSIAQTRKVAVERFKSSVMFKHIKTLESTTLQEQDMDRQVESNLVGTPQEIIDRIEKYMQAGVTMFAAMGFISPTVEATLEDIQLFAEEVIPAFN